MKFISFLIGDDKHTEALFLIEQFYNKQVCKKVKRNKENGSEAESSNGKEDKDKKKEPCGNTGWCTKCSNLSLKENPAFLKCLDEILLDNFKFIQQITILLEAPKESPYDGQTF